MFGLGEQVGCDELGGGGVVGDHEDLARPGHDVDPHRARHDLLRQRHVEVPRTHDHIRARDRFGPEGERRDRPGAADFVDLVHSGLAGGDQQVGRDPAFRRGRRRHDDPLHARHPRRDGAHQDRRDQRGLTPLPPGHVDARLPDRVHHLAEHRPGAIEGHEPGAQLASVKLLDLRGGPVQRTQEPAVHRRGGGLHLGRADAQVGCTESGTVEAAGVVDQGPVAPAPDVLQDAAHAPYSLRV